ncbi:MAG: cytochrome c [Thermodesulfovibrionales bacterium]|nr:cytochrome c [Thermodesulfovibrionales bacterium]
MNIPLARVLLLCIGVLSLVLGGCNKAGEQNELPTKTEVKTTQGNTGEKLFQEHCVRCHQDGSRMKAIKKQEDITSAMRAPKGSMPKFGDREISENDAEVLAKYVFFSILFKR